MESRVFEHVIIKADGIDWSLDLGINLFCCFFFFVCDFN